MAPLPIKFTELLQLSSVNIDTSAIGFNSCVRPLPSHPQLLRISRMPMCCPPLLLLTPSRLQQQTLESDSYVCIREKKNDSASPEVVIVDLKNGNNVMRRPIKADSAIMHFTRQVIALRAQSRTLQIFDLEQKAKLKSTSMNEDVVFWKWISDTTIGLVTDAAVYHWDVFDPNQAAPVKMFARNDNLSVRTL